MKTVKQIPILFNDEMVRAILAGRKTQTRRVMKVQPPSDNHQLLNIMSSTDRRREGKSYWAILNTKKTRIEHSETQYFSFPFGQIGDRLWVRETWRGLVGINPPHEPLKTGIARYTPDQEYCRRVEYRATQGVDAEPWRPSIHMPRWASRITLEITAVRVERLQDISEKDARAEGVCGEAEAAESGLRWHDKPLRAFRFLWQSIKGPESWDKNPWVWVLEFKRVDSGVSA
jgi:hypothetical protein